MGRPRTYTEPRIATAVRLPVSLRDELQHTASQRDVSVNLLITHAISDYLRRLPARGDGDGGGGTDDGPGASGETRGGA